MSTITFSATLPNGEVVTRTSGTMPYVATVGGATWHKTFAAATKAANSRGGVVTPVTPTAFNGKITPEWEATMATGWGDIPSTTMAELIIDKESKVKKAKPALPTEEAPAADPEADEVSPRLTADEEAAQVISDAYDAAHPEVADAEKAAAKKARRRERRLAKRAVETPEAKAERLAARRERRQARKAAKAV